MILKVWVGGRQEGLQWWILDGIRIVAIEYLQNIDPSCSVSNCITNQSGDVHATVDYNLLSKDATTAAVVRCSLAEPTASTGISRDLAVAFDGEAYLENDSGKTIEHIMGRY